MPLDAPLSDHEDDEKMEQPLVPLNSPPSEQTGKDEDNMQTDLDANFRHDLTLAIASPYIRIHTSTLTCKQHLESRRHARFEARPLFHSTSDARLESRRPSLSPASPGP